MEQKQLIKQLTARFQCPIEQRYAFLEQDSQMKAIASRIDLSGSPFIAASATVNYLSNLGNYWGLENPTPIALLEKLLEN